VIGVHVNALISAMTVDWSSDDPTAGLTEAEIAALYASAAAWEQRSGCAILEATRPHTLGYALTDSPLGLLAWYLDPFTAFGGDAGDQAPVDREAILTSTAIAWFTRTAASAARIYKEGSDSFYGGERTEHPTAVAVFPGDGTIRWIAERSHNVVRWTEYDRGGHFAALQAPDLFVADIRGFATQLGCG
jgi:pimeloyl-ACP methyl ester carboxylesterase